MRTPPRNQTTTHKARPEIRRGPVARAAAFTLLELLAVIVIASILAVASAPVFSGLDRTRAHAAASEAERDVSFARQYAHATGRAVWVEFDASAERWTLLVEDPDNPGRSNATEMPDPAGRGAYTREIDEEIPGASITSASFDGGQVIGFDWLGRPFTDDATPLIATGSVTFADGPTLRVRPVTGLVLVETSP